MTGELAHHFGVAETLLGNLGSEDVAALIEAASDVAVILDGQGVVRDLAVEAQDLSSEGYSKWLGQPWIDTVTAESREKIEALLRDSTNPDARARQVNHPSRQGQDVPILYNVVPVGSEGRMVALGRDLRAMAALQQRLVEAQQSMEREYARLRHAETRYRLLFQISSEAVLIIDAPSRKVVEANPAAGRLLDWPAERLVGKVFPNGLDEESGLAVEGLLTSAKQSGRSDELSVRLAESGRQFLVSASHFRQMAESYFLIRLSPLRADDSAEFVPRAKSKLLRFIENAADGMVVTTPAGQILTANRAFLELAQLSSEEQAEGESLERWLGRPGVDLNVLLSNLREHGSVRLFATSLRGEHGSRSEVEISAVSVLNSEQPCLGFMIRDVSRRLVSGVQDKRELPRSVDQLTELVGRVSLKDIVRETADVIERLCIEAALELTGDNRASAAEMLGLSRQSLYVKLRRHGLSDSSSETEH